MLGELRLPVGVTHAYVVSAKRLRNRRGGNAYGKVVKKIPPYIAIRGHNALTQSTVENTENKTSLRLFLLTISWLPNNIQESFRWLIRR